MQLHDFWWYSHFPDPSLGLTRSKHDSIRPPAVSPSRTHRRGSNETTPPAGTRRHPIQRRRSDGGNVSLARTESDRHRVSEYVVSIPRSDRWSSNVSNCPPDTRHTRLPGKARKGEGDAQRQGDRITNRHSPSHWLLARSRDRDAATA